MVRDFGVGEGAETGDANRKRPAQENLEERSKILIVIFIEDLLKLGLERWGRQTKSSHTSGPARWHQLRSISAFLWNYYVKGMI